MIKLNGIFNILELKINKIFDGVFEWLRGFNKVIYDIKLNVIKMNIIGVFFLVCGFLIIDYFRNIKELE